MDHLPALCGFLPPVWIQRSLKGSESLLFTLLYPRGVACMSRHQGQAAVLSKMLKDMYDHFYWYELFYGLRFGLIVETDSPSPNKGLKSVSLTGWWGASSHHSKYLQVVESTLQWLKSFTNKWCLKRLSVLQLCLDFVSDGLTGWINLLLFWREGCSTGNDNLISGSSRWSCEQTYSSNIPPRCRYAVCAANRLQNTDALPAK